MSAFSTLLALINAQIKTNGQKAITGAKLNGVLVQMVNELGSGYQFIDIATPATDPGTPDENVWYIASQAGTYTNFGGIIVNENEVCALVWNGSWTKKVTGAATAAQVNQLGQEVGSNKSYYAAADTPIFSNIVINGGNTSVTVKFASTAFRIYDNRGVVVAETTDYYNAEFTIASFDRLVYDLENNTIQKESLNTPGRFIDLLAIGGESISGLLVPYLYSYIYKRDISRIPLLEKRELGLFYIIRSNRPLYLEENTSTGVVYFKFGGVINVRGIVEKNYTISQLATELNTSLVTSTKGVADCIAIPNVNNLVFDSETLTMKLKSRFGLKISDIPLIMTSSGTVTYVDQGLLNVYDYNDTVKSFSNDKLEDIFLIRSDRGSIYLEEDTSYGSVFLKYPGTLYLRGAFSKGYTIQQLASEIGVSLVTSIKGETGCLEIPNTSSLVYDNVAGVMRFRARSARVITDTILITSSSGTITYINQGLLNAYDNKQAASDESASSIVDYYSRKTKEIENLAKNNDVSFFFFSDIHAQSVNFQRIVQLANSLGTSKVKAIINGGDTVEQVVGDGLGWYNDIIDLSNIDVLTCCGNHDIWSALWTPASRTDVYNAVIAPVASKVQGLVQPTGAAANGDCYYYKDYGNIRVIVLCAMVESQSSQMFWDSAQATWFENVLADARTNNKYVVCVNHSPFAKADATLDVETKWTSYYAKTWKNDTEHQIFDSIHTSMEAVNLVSSFISSGGKFICWLTGHLHIDSIQKLSGQVMINIASANNAKHVDGYKTDSVDNYIYDCFNYIGFDTANNFIKIFRIGWDMDASLRVRNLLTYDFVNQTLVTEN